MIIGKDNNHHRFKSSVLNGIREIPVSNGRQTDISNARVALVQKKGKEHPNQSINNGYMVENINVTS